MLMWFIFRPLLHIVAYSLSLYVLDTYTTLWWIDFVFTAQSNIDLIKIYFLIGVIFWFAFVIVKRIISLFALPFQILTLWLVGIVINILVFYICEFIINTYLTGITMNIQSLSGLFIVSLLLSVSVTFIYRLFKKVI